MTWIVGTGTMFGHAVLASDIHATLKYGKGEEHYIDCLQKIYPLGKFVVGGFAGSVKIGFSIISSLHRRAQGRNIFCPRFLSRVDLLICVMFVQ